ncbi:MAG: YqeG family HAD IIIA-type phosphatase [Oscillospiraceae bacterium]|nr:YqeG family HAD IIIA-type phosphatase [Oscillospiraceae bacterium]
MKKKIFLPDIIYRHVWDIDLRDLLRIGISGLILDIDNTLAVADHPDPYEEVSAWLAAAADNFSAIILSNNKLGRVAPFAKKLGLKYIHMALKPIPFNFFKAAKILGKPPEQLAVIGDQLFTDIAGGNLSNMYTVLVSSPELEKESGVFSRAKRWLEKKALSSGDVPRAL